MRHFFLSITLFATIAGLGFCQTVSPSKPGQAAPRFEGRVLTGGTGVFDLAKLKGKVVVLDFWATWCAPCIGQFPHINELTDKFKGRPVQFAAVSIDTGQDAQDKIARLLKVRPLKPMVVLGDPKIATAYGFSSIPTTVLIDSSGKIDAIVHTSSLTAEAIERLLAGKPSGLATEPESAQSIPTTPETPQLFSVSIKKSVMTDEGSSTRTRSGAKYFEIEQIGYTLPELAASLAQVPVSRVVLEGEFPKDRWDVVGSFQASGAVVRPQILALASATLGVTFTKEMRELETYVFRCPQGPRIGTAGEMTAAKEGSTFSLNSSQGNIAGQASEVKSLLIVIEGFCKAPVIDETGLTGLLDYRFQFTPGDLESLLRALSQAGFEVKKEKRAIEMLVVRKSR